MTVDFITYCELSEGERHLNGILNLTASNFQRFSGNIIGAAQRELEAGFEERTTYETIMQRSRDVDPSEFNWAQEHYNKTCNDINKLKKFIETWTFIREDGRGRLRDLLSFLPTIGRQIEKLDPMYAWYVDCLLENGMDDLATVGDIEVYVA